MSEEPSGPLEDDLSEVVGRERRRQNFSTQIRRSPLTEKLRLAGSIGWLVVIPTLLGTFAGRWLDERLGQPVFWSASLTFVAAIAGALMAWRHVQSTLQSD